MSSSTTPLLLLLNELLISHEDGNRQEQEEGIRSALDAIHAMVGCGLPPISSPLTSRDLVCIVKTLLTAHPELSRIPSTAEGSLPLHLAASLGDVNVASVLLDHYPEAASKPNAKGKIPLHYAAREGRVDMVRLFMKVAPYTAAIKSKKDKLALHFAAGEGHVAIVQALLSAYPRGASITSKKGKVPLHFAARWGHIPIALDLLYLFPDGIRTLDMDGSLPLHDAAREGQYLMCRFLVERFPIALATANLRDDIPLFPAVRSGNVELVAFLIQAWPEGGRYVLQKISTEDGVAEWNRDAFELILRGAVNNLEGCELLRNRERPNFRLTSALNPVLVSQPPDEEAEQVGSTQTERAFSFHEKSMPVPLPKDSENNEPWLLEDVSKMVSTTSSSAKCKKRSCCKEKSRSKSPVLNTNAKSQQEGVEVKQHKRAKCCQNCCKRCRSHLGVQPSCFADCQCQCEVVIPRVFLALHAAFESNASQPVVEYILDYETAEGCFDVNRQDDMGQYALHHAVKWAKNDAERAALVAERIVKPFPEAASKADANGSFPLWDAIHENAHYELISILVSAHLPAAITVIRDVIRPVELACHRSCDLNTVYQLLRVDPSALETMVTR
ncbi:hypothetical protein ACA910_017060 [Epithemia clementina (nom. ined.)]